jgi:uncharacterized membrane protein
VQTSTRKLIQAIFYEIIGIILVIPIVMFVFDESLEVSGFLSVVISLVAVSWNYVFNTIFEFWEARQIRKGRSIYRRILHAIGFEGGLAVFTVPLIAYWLDISLWVAVIADIGLLTVFFFYALVFHWCFDRIFGLPESAV